MSQDWSQITKDKVAEMRELRGAGGTPEVMKAFSEMAKAALTAKALDTKTKELIALAIGVAVRCDACVAFHAKAALEQGATREEVMETMGMAIYMGAGPSVMYAADAVRAFDQFVKAKADAATAG